MTVLARMDDPASIRLLRRRHEQAWADDAASRKFTPEQYAEWTSLRSTHRFMMHTGKSLVIWDWFMDHPVVKDVLEIDSLRADLDKGLTAGFVSDKYIYEISHTPVRVSTGVFLWLPRQAGCHMSDRDGSHSCSVSMIYRTVSNPETPMEGHRYVLESNVFTQRYPGVRL